MKIPEKFSYFNGCTLTFYSNFIFLPTFDIIADNGLYQINPLIASVLNKRSAREKEILKIYADYGNFTAVQLQVKSEDLNVIIVLGYPVPFERCGAAVFDYNLIVMVSAPEPYTNYEKMLLPFDSTTWYYLMGVFCSAFIGIFVLNRTPKLFRDLVYGKNVNMPSFNVIGTFFGIGQTKLPDNNFGRIILMTFIIFCLVFRTAYQGKTK